VLFKLDIEFLGHLVSVQGTQLIWYPVPVPDKLKAIRGWPTTHCLRDVRAFFGLVSYYGRFVRNFASIAPLTDVCKSRSLFFALIITVSNGSRLSNDQKEYLPDGSRCLLSSTMRSNIDLTKKNTIFKWIDEAELAFCRLKHALVDATTLAFPVFGLVSYYRRFVRNFASIAEPLTDVCKSRSLFFALIITVSNGSRLSNDQKEYLPDGSRCLLSSTMRSNIDLTKKNTIFKWIDEAELAFCRLKHALVDATTLAFPVP